MLDQDTTNTQAGHIAARIKPAQLSLEQCQAVYRAAIDSAVKDSESDAWWAAVAQEIREVCAAPTVAAAAAVIAWWHHDWDEVSDTAKAAAKRIRAAAKAAS